MRSRKKPVKSATPAKWSREWYSCASADELLAAMSEIDNQVQGSAMEQLMTRLTWEARFQLLEQELKRRMKKQSA